jgi:Skp family chaperone for outer membrane proteins
MHDIAIALISAIGGFAACWLLKSAAMAELAVARDRIVALEADVRARAADLRAKVTGKVEAVKADAQAEVAAVEGKVDAVKAAL